MNKIIALLGWVLLSGCAGNYMDKVSQDEISKYCPNYEFNEFHFGSLAKNSCNLAIEENIDEINAARKVKREQFEEEQRQLEIAQQAELDRANNIAESIGVSYEGEFTDAFYSAINGYNFKDGLYQLDMNIKIQYCSGLKCYGTIEGVWTPVVFNGYQGMIIGSYFGGGYHRAYVYNGKIMFTKVES